MSAPRTTPPLVSALRVVALALALSPPAQAQEGPGSATPVSPASSAAMPAPVMDAAPVPLAPEVISRDDEGRTTIRATRITERLAIDGRLDDEAYRTVRSFGDFVQQEPHEGRQASQRIDVWVLFDDEHLFIAARLWQDPSLRMVANELRRDGQNTFDNDNFAVILDTFRDRRNGFLFQTNPIGVIVDQQMTDEGASFNRDWNTVWEVRTTRDAGGWSVEMAVPFKSLRFPPGAAQVWGINFRRNLQARSEYAYLAPIPASAGRRGLARVSQAATLVGLQIDKPMRQFELKPFAITSLTTDRENEPLRENDLDASAGLDLKAGLGRGLTADLTIHTDFAQVEEDEAQVNLSRFSLFLPEKRDFFLEGQGLFAFGGVPVNRGPGGGGPPVAPILFFSRRIGIVDDNPVQILAGGRVTGKVGGWAIGAIQIRQDDSYVTDDDGTVRPVQDTDFTVLRVRRDILRRSSVGIIYTRRAPTEDASVTNQAGGFDLLFAPTQELTLNGYLAKSDTPGRRGDDLSYRARLDYNADKYGLQVEQLAVGTNFDPAVGLLRREDFQRSFVEGRFSPRPKGLPWLRKWNVTAGLDYITDNDRVLESRTQQAGTRLELSNGDEFSVDLERSFEALDEALELTEDHVIPVGTYTFPSVRGEYRLGPRHRVTGEIGGRVGGFYDGTLRELSYRGRVEVTSAVSLEPNLAFNRIDRPGADPFWINVAGLRATWALSPRAVASTLVQYSSSSGGVTASARMRWEYRPGSDLFFVYSEGRDTLVPGTALNSRSVAIKMTRLFRF